MNCIEVKNFSFQYPKESHAALYQVSMEVEEGSFVVLCGKHSASAV